MKNLLYIFPLIAMVQSVQAVIIDEKTFEKDYFGKTKVERDYVAAYANAIHSIPVDMGMCVVNCDFPFLSTAIGFYREGDTISFGELEAKPNVSRLPTELKTILEIQFYDAITTALVNSEGDAVYILDLGGFSLTESQLIFVETPVKKPEKPKVYVEIPGLSIVDSWTWDGVGYVKLTWHQGNICYIKTGCYDYDFSLRFMQVGELGYGRPIYCQLGYHSTYIWLAGEMRGGVKVFLDNSVIDDYQGQNMEIPYQFQQRPGWF